MTTWFSRTPSGSSRQLTNRPPGSRSYGSGCLGARRLGARRLDARRLVTRSHGSRRRRRAGLVGAAVLGLLTLTAPGHADTIELPAPQADQLGGSELFQALGTPQDQLPGYLAPGPLSNDELVLVEVTGDGRVTRVRDEQRIRVSGTGDYFVRIAGPARAAVALGGDVPVLSFGDIIWQGFSTGGRELAARIELDPALEASHLPMRMSLSFTANGRRSAVGPDGQLPGPGVLTLTLDNLTHQRVSLPTGSDADARQLAPALDRLLAEARGAGGRLPTTRTGIPPQLRVTAATTRQAVQVMPLRLRGALRVAATSQPAAASAVRIDSLLRDSVRLDLRVRQAGKVALELTAVPTLDPRALTPPRGAVSWSAWAGSDPPIAERRAALDALVQAAATGSCGSAYSPYLGSQLEPRGRTAFRYQLATTRPAAAEPARLTPRPVPIGLAVLGALALLGSGVVLWRRS